MKTKPRKITLGTKEWADVNINCYIGCSNNCRYCYAKKMAIRFKRKTEDNWKIMEPNQTKINKGYRKRNGRIMFPTSHDITIQSLSGSLVILEKLLRANNDVLITTKPNFKCIREICNRLKEFKDLIQFRFTITSLNDDLLAFWEPGAPKSKSRMDSLRHAFKQGFKTSISIEPFLDRDPYILVNKLKLFTTESIWIGKMNYIRAKGHLEHEKRYYDYIRDINKKQNLLNIIEKSKKYDQSYLRLKDSIFNYLS